MNKAEIFAVNKGIKLFKERCLEFPLIKAWNSMRWAKGESQVP